MAYCGPRGIPHSHFLGGPLHWTAADRDKAIWWQLRQADTCPSCGTRGEEWDEARGGSRNAYVPELARCRGCEVTGRTEETREFKDGGRGLRVSLRRRRGV